MRVGLTFDLRDEYLAMGHSAEDTAEFDKPETIEGIEGALRELGYETDRIGHAASLAARLTAGDQWDMVFNIAEGLRGVGRESLVPALLDAWDIPYTFSDPLVLALALHKGMAKRVIRDLGVPTPAFAVVESNADLAGVDLPFPLFAKPVAEGTGKGITAASRIRTTNELRIVCAELLARFRQPVLVETYLPGREFTIGIAGTGPDAEVLGVMEVILGDGAEADAYSYFNKENYQGRVSYRLVDDAPAARAAELALAGWRGLGCRDGGRMDFRLDAGGEPNFIEVNPLAGLNPVHSDLPIICRLNGMPYVELIRRIMDSARRRCQS
jgi:D-alanine-D-alanine ligase